VNNVESRAKEKSNEKGGRNKGEEGVGVTIEALCD
jgi:hypothetical protein